MDRQFSRYYVYIKPVIRNKHVRTYSSLIFSLITLAMFAILAIRPTLATIVSLQKAVSEQSDILGQLRQKQNDLILARNNYQKIDPNLRTVLINLLPDSTNIPSMITIIQSLAQSHQASLSGIQFQPIDIQPEPKELSKKSELQGLDFSINVQGTYTNLVDFLESLSRTKRFVNIESVSLSKTEEGLIMSVVGKAYYYKN